MKVGIISKFLFSHLGYGTMVRSLLREFIRQGADICLFLDGTSKSDLSRAIISAEDYTLFMSLIKEEKPDIWLHIAPGCRFGPRERYKGIYAVGFSMFEALHNPPQWAKRVKEVDEIWAPSTFNLKNFQELGLAKEKIFLMPLGVDTEQYLPRDIKKRIQNKRGEEFEFIAYSVGAYRQRKNFGLLMAAFAQLFSGHQDKLLIIKTSPSDYNLFYNDFQAVKKSIPQTPPIVGYIRKLKEKEMPTFFNMGDVFVYASGGEGQGLPPLEAMSCGKPVVSTYNSAMADYIKEEIAYPVKSLYFKGEQYAIPVMSDLKDKIWRVYKNREEAIEKGKKARHYIEKNRSLQICCRRMIDRLKEIVK